MAGKPYMPFYGGDWKKKSGLMKCKSEGRAVWIEALLAMHNDDDYKISGDIDELNQVFSLPASEIIRGIEQLKKNNVCDASRSSDGTITLVSRRRKREYYARLNDNERAKRYRDKKKSQSGHDEVVPLDSDIDNDIVINRNKKVSKFPFSDLWDQYRKKIGKKKAESIWGRTSESDRLVIMDHVQAFVEATPDKEYRPNLSTYLNQRRWEDEELPSVKGDTERLLTHREMIDTGKKMHYFEAVEQKTGKPLWRLK